MTFCNPLKQDTLLINLYIAVALLVSDHETLLLTSLLYNMSLRFVTVGSGQLDVGNEMLSVSKYLMKCANYALYLYQPMFYRDLQVNASIRRQGKQDMNLLLLNQP